jgi:hypothetical protein
MRLKHRQILSYLLLATYASIAVLGDGLHWLAHETGHHHGEFLVTSTSHGLGHEHSLPLATGALPTGRVLSATDADVDSHVCGICTFLFQALSQPAEVAATIDWQPVVVATIFQQQPIYSPTSVGPHAPRGPPLLA